MSSAVSRSLPCSASSRTTRRGTASCSGAGRDRQDDALGDRCRRSAGARAARARRSAERCRGAVLVRRADRPPRRGRLSGAARPAGAAAARAARLRSCAPSRRASPPSRTTIAVGLLNALRALAADGPLLVAVDDVQWLDPSVRRRAHLRRAPTRRRGGHLLLRSGAPASPSALEQALERRGLGRLDVGPLSLGAMRRLLAERLGLSLSRHRLRRVSSRHARQPAVRARGRAHARRAGGLRDSARRLPVPDAVEDLLGTRVASASGHRCAGCCSRVALSADLRRSRSLPRSPRRRPSTTPSTQGCSSSTETACVPRTRFFAAAAKTHSRRTRAAASCTWSWPTSSSTSELRARHLALATDGFRRRARGDGRRRRREPPRRAAHGTEAVELAEHALRLTAAGGDRAQRASARARRATLEVAATRNSGDGSAPRASSTRCRPALVRGRAWCSCSSAARSRSNDDIEHYLERALAESGTTRRLRAFDRSRSSRATRRSSRVERIARGGERGRSRRCTRPGGAGPRGGAARALRARLGTQPARTPDRRPLRAAFGTCRTPPTTWSGRPSGSPASGSSGAARSSRRERLSTRCVASPTSGASPCSYALQRLHLCELELRAGDWEAAGRLLDEWAELGRAGAAELADVRALPRAACRGPRLSRRGRALGGARDRSGRRRTASRWDLLEALRARGIAALLAYDRELARPRACARSGSTRDARGSTSPASSRSLPISSRRSSSSASSTKPLAVTARLSELCRAARRIPGVSRPRSAAPRSSRLRRSRLRQDAAAQ